MDEEKIAPPQTTKDLADYLDIICAGEPATTRRFQSCIVTAPGGRVLRIMREEDFQRVFGKTTRLVEPLFTFVQDAEAEQWPNPAA